MKPIQKSVVYRTSAATNVQNSGGYLSITGLNPVPKKDLISIKQVKYRSETVQVYTIASTVAPTASTKYTVIVYDPNRTDSGYSESTKSYSYVTPPVITTIGALAADQREYINDQLVAKINADGSNHAVAVSLGTGTGFTITDDGGYYPVFSQSMTNVLGANLVEVATNPDGTGFTASECTLTTAAIASFGVGSILANSQAVTDKMFGNLISGDIYYNPLTTAGLPAVSGQNYDGFEVLSLSKQDTPTITGHYTYIDSSQIVFVDNGTGSSTANLAGFKAFERAMLGQIFQTFDLDAPTIKYMGNTGVVSQGLNTGLPSGVAQAENVVSFGNGFTAHYSPIATSTLLALVSTNDGLGLVLDATAAEGVELSAPTWANSGKSFVVGKTAFSVYAKITLDDASGVNPLWVGFRKKAAYNATFTSYTDYAVIGIGNSAGQIHTNTEKNGAGNTSTDTTVVWADATTRTLEVRVDITGACTFFIDGYKPTVTQAFTLDTDDEMIPCIYALQSADLATPSLLEFAAVASNQWRS